MTKRIDLIRRGERNPERSTYLEPVEAACKCSKVSVNIKTKIDEREGLSHGNTFIIKTFALTKG